jgi:3-oxoacyl-(acyl-carrier-protein) synthase
VDAAITTLSLATFDRMRAYSHREDKTPAPFSRDRDGLILGEGAGVLVLESLSHALKRGAQILAEVAGYGATTDAHHIVAPLEDGAGSAAAVNRALEDAHLNTGDIQYINAHGTGTSVNDSAETMAIKTAFGEKAYDVPISSTKSMTGHMMGAAGAAEAIFCIKAIRDGAIPPTINYGEPDPVCDLDYVPHQGRQIPVDAAMSNSFGFGGHNSVLVFRQYDG